MRHSDRTTMETFTGGWFDFSAMHPDDIDIRDIAQALSLTCRFGGQIPFFYSVAQHALLVAELVSSHFNRPDLKYAALHHDSHEAYVGDVPTPLKNTFGLEYNRLVDKIDDVICYKLGIDPKAIDDPVVHKADRLALFIEAAKLKVSRGVGSAWGTDSVSPEATIYGHWVTGAEPLRVADAFIGQHQVLIRDDPVVSHAVHTVV